MQKRCQLINVDVDVDVDRCSVIKLAVFMLETLMSSEYKNGK